MENLPEEIELRLLAESYAHKVSKQTEDSLKRAKIFDCYLPITDEKELLLFRWMIKNNTRELIYFWEDKRRFENNYPIYLGCEFRSDINTIEVCSTQSRVRLTDVRQDKVYISWTKRADKNLSPREERQTLIVPPNIIEAYCTERGCCYEEIRHFRRSYYKRKLEERRHKTDSVKHLLLAVLLYSTGVEIERLEEMNYEQIQNAACLML